MLLSGSCSNRSSQTTENTSSFSAVSEEKINADKPYLHFKKGNKFDFGTVQKETDIIPISIEVENCGNVPLLIYKADVSCGCISVEIPKEPILPKKTAIVYIKINSENQEGYFNKTVFLNSNATNDVEILHIKGVIKK